MKEFQELTEKILKFRRDRDWEQFHNPKDVALSLVLEATEVLEHFQWKNPEEVKNHAKSHINEIGEELADVMYWVLVLSHDLNIDLKESLSKKIKKNEDKYPIEKAKGKHTKYNKL